MDKKFFVFPRSQAGVSMGDVVCWKPDTDTLLDVNGNPFNALAFLVRGESSFWMTISNRADIESFLQQQEKPDIEGKLLALCKQALEWVEAEYEDGENGDPRLKWGDCAELDSLVSGLRAAIKGE